MSGESRLISKGGRQRSAAGLAGLGFLSCVIYGLITFFTAHFRYGSPTRERPILLVLVLFSVVFVLYLFAIWWAMRVPQDRWLLATILVSAVVFRFIMLRSEPIQEVDIYRYLWDGAVSSAGVSPFRYPPQVVVQGRPNPRLADDLNRMFEIRDSNAALGVILTRIHYPHVPTVYPPVSQWGFRFVHWLTPSDSTVDQRLLWMRSWLVTCDLATLLVLMSLLRSVELPLGLSVSYGWCPLVLKEIANSGHLDSMAVLLTTLSIYAAVQAVGRDARINHSRPIVTNLWLCLSAVLLSLGVGSKIYPVVLMPWLLAVTWRSCRHNLLPVFSVFVLFVSITYVIFIPMMPWHQPASLRDMAATSATQPLDGLRTFVRHWEMNDFLFLIVVENLKPMQDFPPQKVAWFSVIPESAREGLMGFVHEQTGIAPEEIPFQISRTITGCIFAVVALMLIVRVRNEADPVAWLRVAFLTVAWFWLLSPTQNPWYWTWALPLLPFARGRAWWLVSGICLMYYLRFWTEYHYTGVPMAGTDYEGTLFFDMVITWLEFAPWFGLLFAEWCWRQRAERSDRGDGGHPGGSKRRHDGSDRKADRQ